MNTPLDPHVLRPDALGHLTAEAAELDLPPDDIAQSSTRLYLSGIQALVHLPILQHLRDQAAGLNTAGFISGYRGTPSGADPIPLPLDAPDHVPSRRQRAARTEPAARSKPAQRLVRRRHRDPC